MKEKNIIMKSEKVFVLFTIILLLFFLTACAQQKVNNVGSNDASKSNKAPLINATGEEYVPGLPSENQTMPEGFIPVEDVLALKPITKVLTESEKALILKSANSSFLERRNDAEKCGTDGPQVCDSTNSTLPNECYARVSNTTVLYEGKCK